jgi:hypothetical protein
MKCATWNGRAVKTAESHVPYPPFRPPPPPMHKSLRVLLRIVSSLKGVDA